MEPAIVPAERPSRLPLVIHILVILLLLLAFVSGVLIWYGQNVNSGADEPTFNIRPWVLLHGYLNPLLCVMFGYLLCQHIRYGWAMRANWVTGLFMELVYAVLILTGASLYYSPESWRTVILLIHHYTGIAVPVAIGLHWITSLIWVKRLPK